MVKNKNGFSLVELMIGLGVSTLVSLALVDTTKMLTSSQKGQASQTSAAALANMMAQNLRFQSTCSTIMNNGGNNIPYNRNQALSNEGMPIALTISGIRAGPTGAATQIRGADNSVTTGASPAFNGATSDLRVYNLQINRMAFRQLAESGSQRFGFVYVDFEVPNTSTFLWGGYAIRRKILGGVVLEAAGASVTNCYGNSPQTDLAAICTQMGCTWTAPNCNCQKPEFTCGPGELFWGVHAQTGLPICKELGGGSCPAGQYVSGLGLERVICSAVPDEPVVESSTNCVSTTLSWTASSNSCSAVIASASNGGTATATDSTGPATGSANFTCNAGTWSAPSGATCVAAPACLADGQVAGALYGTCVGNPANINEIRASCCSGTTYSVCDASSDKIYYCGASAPVEPVKCYMYSRTFWWDPSDCDTQARYMRGTYTQCMALQESPTQCNLNPDCGEITPASPLYTNCPP